MRNHDNRILTNQTLFLQRLFCLIFVLFVLPANKAMATSDNTPPVISDFTLLEAGQTLTAGDVIHATVKAEDESGVDSVTGFTTDGIAQFTYNKRSELWEWSYIINENIKNGPYSITTLWARDKYSNVSTYLYPTESVTIVGNTDDHTGPVISDFTLLEAGQTLTAGDVIHATVKAEDESGVDSVTGFTTDGIAQFTYNKRSELWEWSYILSDSVHEGKYSITTLWARDKYSNVSTYLYPDDYIIYTDSIHEHTLIKHEKADATCTTAGTETYWSCNGCGKIFSDKDGKNEISAPVVIPAKGHSLTKTEGKEPTDTENGYEPYWTCSQCNKLFSDKDGKNEISTPVVIPAQGQFSSYTIAYNANGGSGAPASQTKTQGQALTLSATKPSRSNYNFLGWAESATATSAQYQPGGQYTKDASVTLYAIWKDETFVIEDGVLTEYNGYGGNIDLKIVEKEYGVTITSIGNGAFQNKTSVTSITLTNTVGSIGNNAFSGCNHLTRINNLNQTEVTSIGNCAFSDCIRLSQVTLPGNLEFIGSAAFSNCNSLEYLEIPNSVISIADNAFYGCNTLIFHANCGSYAQSWIRKHTVESVIENHKKLKLVPAVAATCTEAGYETHWACEQCNELFRDEAGQSVIQKPVEIQALGHSLTKTEGKEPTDTENGYEAYWTCSQCNKLFSDKDGKNEISAPVVIPAKTHSHSLVKTEAKSATCTEAGYEAYWTCSQCNKIFSDKDGKNEISAPVVIPAKGHNLTKTEGKEPTDTENGYEAYWTCSQCNKLFSDKDGKNEISAPVVIPAKTHSHSLVKTEAKSATCTTAGTETYWSCNSCGKLFSDKDGKNEISAPVVIPAKGHNWGEANYVWSSDNKTITATHICINDSSHKEEETVKVSAKITSPTDGSRGSASYTSEAFNTEGFTVQSKNIVIPMLRNMSVMDLPDMLTTIEDEAFEGISCEAIIIPKNCSTIGKNAFADCKNLLYVKVPMNTVIDSDAFTGCVDVVIDQAN